MSDGAAAGAPPFFNHSTHQGNLSGSCDLSSRPAQIFYMVSYSLVFLVALLLNGFTIKVYFCSPLTCSSVSVFLKNLAVADFLLSLCLPLRVARWASGSTRIWRYHCHVGAAAFYLNMYASILFMGYIAANRYLKIVRSSQTHVLLTMRASHAVAAGTWSFLVSMMMTYVLLSVLTQKDITGSPVRLDCDDLHSQQLSMLLKVVHVSLAAVFLLVLISLLFFYCSASQRLSQAQQAQPVSSGSCALIQARRNLLVLVSVFCMCFVPYHLVRIPYVFGKGWPCPWSRAFFYLKEVTTLLSVLNVCLDPLIYFIFSKSFRVQLGLSKAVSTTRVATYNDYNEGRSFDRLSVVRRTSHEVQNNHNTQTNCDGIVETT